MGARHVQKQLANQLTGSRITFSYKMNTFTFVAIFSAVVIAASASPVKNEKDGYPVVQRFEHGDKCPGKFFYNDCNFCICGPDEHSAICTLKGCLTEVQTRSSAPVIPHNDFFSELGVCTPGQLFYDQCNLCSCGKDSKSAACTDMACQPPKRPHIDGYKQGQECPAGKTFFDECNSCRCGQDGVSAACTLMECNTNSLLRKVSVPSIPHIDNFLEAQECTPGQQFYDRCNRCGCARDGKSAACTLMACLPVDKIRIDDYEMGKKCPAGKTFYDRCNECHCSPNGRAAVCTLKACPNDY